MKPLNLRTGVRILLAALALITVTEPAWAILGVWRRAAVRTTVVVGAVGASEAAAASANARASQEAAAAAAASNPPQHPPRLPNKRPPRLLLPRTRPSRRSRSFANCSRCTTSN